MPDNPGVREQVIRHQGLVRSIAVTIKGTMAPQTELDDLISYGQIGLAEAAAEFDEERGTQFSTYAYYRIRGAILDGACQMGWYKRAHIRRLRFQRMAQEALERQWEEEAETPPAANSPLASVSRSVSRLMVIGLALDAGENGSLGAASLQDRASVPADDLAVHKEACELLQNAMAELPDAERNLVQATYFDGQCLADFARSVGKSRSWASRLHDQAIDRLGRSLRFAGIED